MDYISLIRTNPITGEKVKVHEHVYVCLLKEGLWQKGICLTPEGYEVHHKDFNKKNNDADNLELLTCSEHHKIHWEHDKECNDERRKNLSEKMKAYYATTTPEQRRARMAKAVEAARSSEWTEERRDLVRKNLKKIYTKTTRAEAAIKAKETRASHES